MVATMPATLTAKIFDSATQQPVAGVRMQLYWVEAHGEVLLRAASTNADGTTPQPLLEASKMSAGTYKLVLHLGDYFELTHADVPTRFLDIVPIVFVIDDASKHAALHVNVSPTRYAVERVDEEALR
jgi:5-hydroxyisourate hydrolase